MLGALFYLRLTSFQNWVRWRGRRLRQPKYLVGAIVGVAYFYFFFFRRMGPVRPPAIHRINGGHAATAVPALPASVPPEWLAVGLAIGAVVLLIIIAFMWVATTERAALGFSEAEIAFLFPAPVTRRALVHFRLLSAQFRSLTGGIFMAIFSNRWSLLGGNAVTHALGWWFIFSTLNLHFNGAAFTLTRLSDRGANVLVRRLVVLAVVVAVVGIALWRSPAAAALFGGAGASEFQHFGEWIVDVTSTAPLGWVLYPLRAVLGPFLAPDWRSFAFALPLGLAVIGLHYVWVVRSAVAFEEASLEKAEKRAARLAAWRSGERRIGRAPSGGRPAPFPLASTGRPETAFLWKNLLSTWPYFNARVFAIAAASVVVISFWLRATRAPAVSLVVGISAVSIGVYILIIGPQFARQDVRSDMRNVDILKTYPLPGWQIVLGELLTPAAILTGVMWLMLLIAVLTLPTGPKVGWLTPAMRGAAGIGLAAVIPAVVLLQLLVPNAAALIFPAWAESMRTRGGGPEVVGQRMIYFFAQLLTMIIALLPAAVAAAALIVMFKFAGLMLPLAIIFAAGAVLAVLLGEVALGVWWLGGRFEKIDVSAELRS